MAVLSVNSRKVARNVGHETQFGMQLNAKSYNIMMAGLYEDPKRAMVREMTTNMGDAHILRDQMWNLKEASTSAMPTPVMSVYANKARKDAKDDPKLNARLAHIAPRDKHYEVQLPSSVEPHMVFQDYGIGMSIDTVLGPQSWRFYEDKEAGVSFVFGVEHPEFDDLVTDPDTEYLGRSGGLYTTLFDSTKDDSNDFTGALGLGSKTPFAMTTTFTFHSTFNGKTHYYVASKDEDGLPKCSCTSEEIDEYGRSLNAEGLDHGIEYDGVRIEVPIGERDWGKMRDEAEDIYAVFEKPPIVTGSSSYTPRPINRKHRVANTFLQHESYYGRTHFVIMGNVAYPVKTDRLDANVANMINELGRSTYTVMPIGSVDFQPSRDGLNYNDRTIAALNLYYRELVRHIKDHIYGQLLHAYITKGRFQFWRELDLIREQVGKTFFNLVQFKPPGASEAYKADFKPFIQFPTAERSLMREKIVDGVVTEVETKWMEETCVAVERRMTHDDTVISNARANESDKLKALAFGRVTRLERYLDTDPSDMRHLVFYIRDTEMKWRRRLDAIVQSEDLSIHSLYQLWPKADFSEEAFLDVFGEYRHHVKVIRLSDVEPIPTRRSQNRGTSGPRGEVPQVFQYNPKGSTYDDSWMPIFKDDWEDEIDEGSRYVNLTKLNSDVPVVLIDRICEKDPNLKVYGIRRSGRRAIKQFDLMDMSDVTTAYAKRFQEIPEDYGRHLVSLEIKERVGDIEDRLNMDEPARVTSDFKPVVFDHTATEEQIELYESVNFIKSKELEYMCQLVGINTQYQEEIEGVDGEKVVVTRDIDETTLRRLLCPALNRYHSDKVLYDRPVVVSRRYVEVEQIVATMDGIGGEPNPYFKTATITASTSYDSNTGSYAVDISDIVDHYAPIVDKYHPSKSEILAAQYLMAEMGLCDYNQMPKWRDVDTSLLNVDSAYDMKEFNPNFSMSMSSETVRGDRYNRSRGQVYGYSNRNNGRVMDYRIARNYDDMASALRRFTNDVWDCTRRSHKDLFTDQRFDINMHYWTADDLHIQYWYDDMVRRIEEAELMRDIANVALMFNIDAPTVAEWVIGDIVEPDELEEAA